MFHMQLVASMPFHVHFFIDLYYDATVRDCAIESKREEMNKKQCWSHSMAGLNYCNN